jgi:hypothetical protein
MKFWGRYVILKYIVVSGFGTIKMSGIDLIMADFTRNM